MRLPFSPPFFILFFYNKSPFTLVTANAGGAPTYGPMGISFRSFRHELEDGIDTSSRALPIRLEINNNSGNAAVNPQTIDIYAQATILFYINMDGSVTSSV